MSLSFFKIFFVFIAAFTLSYLSASSEVCLDFDIFQGYHLERNNQNPIGYILKLKISSKELIADQKVKDPLVPHDFLSVVGILENFQWNGEILSPFKLRMQISRENMQQIRMVLTEEIKPEVEFQMTCYGFDALNGKYFPLLHSRRSTLKGVLAPMGEALEIALSNESLDIDGNSTYSLEIGILPKGKHSIHLELNRNKEIRPWGEKEKSYTK